MTESHDVDSSANRLPQRLPLWRRLTSPRAQGPNSKMGVAVVGVNGRGTSHIGGFIKDDRSVIAAIVDVDEYVGKKRADEVAKKQGFAPRSFATCARRSTRTGSTS